MLLFAVVIISILFLWDEWSNLSLYKPINHEKFNSYFSSIGALATAFSLYLIYMQTKLISEGNNLAFAPNLVLPPTYEFVFYLTNHVENGKLVPFYKLQRDPAEDELLESLSLTLTNYGKSAALDIVISLYDAAAVAAKSFDIRNFVGLHEEIPAIDNDKSNKIDWTRTIEKMALVENFPDTADEDGLKFIVKKYRLSLSFSDGNNFRRTKMYDLRGALRVTDERHYRLTLAISPSRGRH